MVFNLQTDTVRHRPGLVHSLPHSGDVYFSIVLGHPSPSTATGENAVPSSARPAFPLLELSFPERDCFLLLPRKALVVLPGAALLGLLPRTVLAALSYSSPVSKNYQVKG